MQCGTCREDQTKHISSSIKVVAIPLEQVHELGHAQLHAPHLVARLSRKYVKELGRMRARKRKAVKAGFIADHKALVK